MSPAQRKRAIVLDVDGVVSPVGGTATAWGDDVLAGHVFGPVVVSPELCARLDALARNADTSCWWLTSWTVPMRESMHPFPGRHWPDVADVSTFESASPAWWKLRALESWLDQHSELAALAWCDDHLRGGRLAQTRRALARRAVQGLLLSPQTSVGLTPAHLRQIEAWVEVAGG